mmetsp:Transcript_6914/g.21818  ORF Transcript_6914/g.21818 Transcript_6914/m.21818 type:complete len:100 (+) Transcript_6914:2010-2309(+)
MHISCSPDLSVDRAALPECCPTAIFVIVLSPARGVQSFSEKCTDPIHSMPFFCSGVHTCEDKLFCGASEHAEKSVLSMYISISRTITIVTWCSLHPLQI